MYFYWLLLTIKAFRLFNPITGNDVIRINVEFDEESFLKWEDNSKAATTSNEDVGENQIVKVNSIASDNNNCGSSIGNQTQILSDSEE